MAGHRNVTIKDVAARAGVSITAVSHALNEKGTLSEETRARIREIATAMGYQADALARGLRRSQIGVIGIVLRPLDALANYSPPGVDYFLRFAGAAAVSALDHGLSLMQVADLVKGPVTPLAFSLDGYVVTDPVRDDPVVDLLESRSIPYVTLGRDPGKPEASNWVASDDAAATRTALDHLAAGGARSIAFVGGTDDNSWNADAESAYLQWCSEHGATPRHFRSPEGLGEAGGRDLVPQLLANGVPDAIYSLTGRHAAGIQEAMRERGYVAPEHYLLACGTDAAQTRTAEPPITAIDLRPEVLARETVELLARITRGQAPEGRRLVASELIVRRSSQRAE
ncbi:LacI family DNA-binding transcriptional regulator [Leucobacter manosquensis]|uniref:LacI family DNA-binding transcriptional regulator n=1 Tax=Leucobacter manosquensis TaxID=2810611 RepID=A0ABS5M4N6_9MICO|nr:LacI family DNA-binding transcriptional regulator [Leucobacter manosquensis]MBS3182152.1 LacI family DNA-binding transcriptional regulator [Leucobacter manosquensis]